MKVRLYFRDNLVSELSRLRVTLGRGADQDLLVPCPKWERKQVLLEELQGNDIEIQNIGAKSKIHFKLPDGTEKDLLAGERFTLGERGEIIVDEFHRIVVEGSEITQERSRTKVVKLPVEHTTLTQTNLQGNLALSPDAESEFERTQIYQPESEKKAWNLIFEGPDIGTGIQFVWDGNSAVIGRGAQADIVINDRSISKNGHARLTLDSSGQPVIEDLGSANGIKLNGIRRISKHTIQGGDVIYLGDVMLKIILADPGVIALEQQVASRIQEVVGSGGSQWFQNQAVGNPDYFQRKSEEALREKNVFLSLRKRYLALDYKRRLIWLGSLAALAVVFMFPDESGKRVPTPKTQVVAENNRVPISPFDKLTSAQKEEIKKHYVAAQNFLQLKRYDETKTELEQLFGILKDGNYKDARALYSIAEQEMLRVEQERQAEERKAQEAKLKEQISGWINQARKYLEEGDLANAEKMWANIEPLDPGNSEVEEMRRQVEEMQKKKNEAAIRRKQQAVKIQRIMNRLKGPERLYSQERYYEAGLAAEDVLKDRFDYAPAKNKARDIIRRSKSKIEELEGPLLEEARAYSQSADGKNVARARTSYERVLKINPANHQARKELTEMLELVTKRMRSIFSEAVVLESVGDFSGAKHLYEKILQSAPKDNEYYTKSWTRYERLLILDGEL